MSVTPSPPDWVDWLQGLLRGIDDPLPPLPVPLPLLLPLSLLPELPVPGAAETLAAPASVIAAAMVMLRSQR
ncbi:hypothetical protein [Nocardia cyriacigeorgica]|uniref:hypothetical protein n=1 Tax=Nocardia cyriacigeorgica TaxID=135487 RepID=UPI00313C5FE9